MQNSIIIYLVLIIISFTNCSSQPKEINGLGSFDISPDDKQIVFTFFKKNYSSIYVANIDGSYPKKIIASNGLTSYYFQEYSPDGKKIVFIANNKGNLNSSLCIANSDGSNFEVLVDDKQMITEATFSKNGKIIYFCIAGEYKKYSPIGRKDFHNVDVYSIQLQDKKIIKISNLKSYGLGEISDFDSTYLLMRLNAGNESGIYFLNKDSTIKPTRIVPANNPRKDAGLYYTPIYSDTFKIMAFTAPYELYVMNLNNKIAKSVFYNKGGYDLLYIHFYNKQNKILFSIEDSSYIFTINIDGSDMQSTRIIVE